MKSLSYLSKVSGKARAAAFTLVDLLTVAAVLAVFALLLAPALARTQLDSRVFQCLNNQGQLARAWRMYADDSNDKLPTNLHGGRAQNPTEPMWAAGWIDWTSAALNTNRLLLTDPRYSILAPYCGRDAGLFSCPADRFLSPPQRNLGWSQRARSYSANIYNGAGNAEVGPTDYAFVHVLKLSQLVNPGPAATWVSLDEHPDSINDGAFFAPRIGEWFDFPANYHDGGAGVAFADGHTVMHRWQASVLKIPVKFIVPGGSILTKLSDPDVAWLRYRTQRLPGRN